VHGARDAQVPLADGFEYARRLRAPLRVVADCGHLVVGERPRAVVDSIYALLDRVVDLEELPVEPEFAA
jgi:pimeloyl-ACP methyl ester carboxylesterase